MELDYRSHPVVVVDDEPDILKLFRFNYGDDFEIVTAENASRALELLDRADASVIVADQRMPSMSGTELLARSMAIRPDATALLWLDCKDRADGLHRHQRAHRGGEQQPDLPVHHQALGR